MTGSIQRQARFKARSERFLHEVIQKIRASDPKAPENLEAEVRAYLGAGVDYQSVSDMENARILLRALDDRPWTKIQEEPLALLKQHHLDENPRYAPFHDIFFVRRVIDEDDIDNIDDIEDDDALPKDFRFHRFRAVKDGPGRGGFYQGKKNKEVYPEMGLTDDGYRAVLSLATTDPGEKTERGPILSALPLNPDPAASSSCTCYLLNPSNLNYATAWTAEEWSDRPGDEGAALAPGEDVFSLLIASPAGKVYFLEKKDGAPLKAAVDGEIAFREIELGKEPEVWAQLRGGCVIGRAMFHGAEAERKVTPLVNIHSLLPSPSPAE